MTPVSQTANIEPNQTIIIGAGPAGLAIAGRLARAGMPFQVLERGNQISPSWQNHYERLHLHTVKGYSHLPHREFPDDYPKYVPRADLVRYYEDYARDFGIEPVFGADVKRVAEAPDGTWCVDTADQRYEGANVVVATGFNRKPVVPSWPGLPEFGGTVVHSRHYRNAKPYKGQRVLVVGMGNTGAEIALDLLEQGAKPAISVRSPVNVVPRDFLGQSTQESAIRLARLPLPVADALGRFFQHLSIGDLRPYGLKKSHLAPAQQQREQGKTPVMDVGTVRAIKAGDIVVYPDLAYLEKGHAVFSDEQKEAFDAIILATGYACAVEDFVSDAAPLLNEKGVPADCWFAERPGLCFLGFDGYANGLLWSIHGDSARILSHLQERAKKGLNRPHEMARKA